MSNNREYDYYFNIFLIGNSNVGKQSLLSNLIGKEWKGNNLSVLGFDTVNFIYKIVKNIIDYSL